MFKLTSVLSLVVFLGVVGILAESAAVSRRFLKKDARIINGDNSGRDQFPYMAYINTFTNYSSYSGGMLISRNYVLSAAHTMIDVQRAFVFLGFWNFTNNHEEGHQIIPVTAKDILLHPQYDKNLLYNDIALIKLPYPARLNAHVQIIPLPKKTDISLRLTGRKAYAAGWGYTTQKGNASDVLKYIETDIIDNRRCISKYVRHTNICISTASGRSTCYGDSGGPLVIKNGIQDVLVGITSTGTTSSCVSGNPEVFTRITSYVDWIKNNTDVNDFQDIV